MENKSNKTISRKILFVGVAMLVIGIILTVCLGISYKQKYDEWFNEWWYLNSADLNDQPVPLFPIGIVVIFMSFLVIFIGLRPQMTKISTRLTKETLDYAGEDISELGKKGVDISKPIIKKGVDEILTPTISKMKESFEIDEVCPICGDKIDPDEEFCSYCGTKLKIKCPKCGYVNSSKNNYCKKCGTRIN